MGVILCMLLLLTAITMIMLVIITFNPFNLYNIIFERETYRLWKYFIENSDNFVFENKDEWGKHFYWKKDDKTYEAIIRAEPLSPKAGRCGIFDGTDCVLCAFDKHSSNKMMKKLLEKI